MGKYAEAVGLLQFEVGGISYSLEPTVEDSLSFLELYNEGREKKNLLRLLHPWIVNFINRHEGLSEDSDEYEKLQVFVAKHIVTFFIEFGVSFELFSRDDLKQMAKAQDFRPAPTRKG
jgi:hypothetical protein